MFPTNFLTHSPDEVLAVAAERRLLEEARDEAVVVDLGDVLLLERAHSLARLARLVLGVAVVDGARHGGRAGQRHDGDGARSALKQRARYCGDLAATPIIRLIN